MCNTKDTSLLECSKRSQVGLFSCDHSETAGARCYGILVHNMFVDIQLLYYITLTILHIDIDECDLQIDGCAHNCTNVIGSYVCSCMNGYVLDTDQKDCIGNISFFVVHPLLKL